MAPKSRPQPPAVRPLLRAFEENDLKEAQRLLAEAGPQVPGILARLWDDDGWHALHWAVHHNNLEALTLLLAFHVDPNLQTQDTFGQSAIVLAARLGHTGLCRALLEAGATLAAAARDGRDALQCALAEGHPLTAHFLATQPWRPVAPAVRHRYAVPKAKQPVPRRTTMQPAPLSRRAASFLSPALPLAPLCVSALPLHTALTLSVIAGGVLLRGVYRGRLHYYAFWLGSVAMVTAAWVSLILPAELLHGPAAPFPWRRHAAFALSLAAAGWLVRLIRADPGRLPWDDLRLGLVTAAEEGHDIHALVCYTCMTRKPYRSKHSWAEGRCIARFDHHCVWLDQAVGAGNHVAFLGFLVVHGFLQLLFNLVAQQHLSELAAWTSTHFCLAYIYFFNCVTGLFVGYLTYTTLYDAGCNATVNERASAGRPPYSEYCGYHPEAGFVTRFDYGFFPNWYDFFSPARRKLWFSAFDLDRIPPVTTSLIWAQWAAPSVPAPKKTF